MVFLVFVVEFLVDTVLDLSFWLASNLRNDFANLGCSWINWILADDVPYFLSGHLITSSDS